jgi:hypothetical protein
MHYRSLVGSGTVTFVTDPDGKKRGLDAVMRHYSPRTEFTYPQAVVDQTTILRLDVTDLSGKKR